ncbi:hypothetical protein B7P43_G04110 [Cryptotermes secundus]|nr:hypothetical protein B7P43_G04110 [Cryptotermes secundus]
MDRGDLPRLVDVVPKAVLETEEMQSGASLVEEFAGAGGEPTSSAEGENRSQENESAQALAGNEEETVPTRSENADRTVAVTDVRVEGDGKVVEAQENGFLGKKYMSVGLQNEDPIIVMLGTAEGRPDNTDSKGGKVTDMSAGVENEENKSARIDSNGNRPVDAWSSKNHSLKTGSMDTSLLITRNKENISVTGTKGNRPEGIGSQDCTLRETGVKENSNCSSPVLNGSDGEVSVLSHTEENCLSGIREEGKRPEMPHAGLTDTNGNVELRLVEEIRHMETTLKENGHVKTDETEYMHVEEGPKENSNVETGMKINMIMETSVKEEIHTVARNEDCSPVGTDSGESDVLTEGSALADNQGSRDLVSRDDESKAVETVGDDNSPVLQDSSENSPLETLRKDDMPVLSDSNESSSLVMQDVENNSVVIDTVDKKSVGADIEEGFSVGTVSVENNSVLSCGRGTNLVLTEDIPEATSKEHSNVMIRNEESIALVTGNAGVDGVGNLAISQEDRPVVCNSFRTGSEDSKENMNVTGNLPVERVTGTAETEKLPEGSSQEAGVTPKPCLEVPEDAFVVAVPQRQDLPSDSDEEDFLMNLPELELLEQGGTVFQPATGALLTASDAFFPFRCWGPTSHLATIGEDEEDDATNQGVPGVAVISEVEREEDVMGHVEEDMNPALSAESRLDNLLLNAGELKPGLEDTEKMPVTKNEEPDVTADDSDAAMMSSSPDGADTAMEESPLASSASRLPPDGHEFPPNYTEHNPFTVGSPALIELELEKPPPPVPPLAPPTRKFATEELRSPVRVPAWRKDEKSECSVKDKIAMFSTAGEVPTPRRRFSSSEDVFLDSRPPPPEPLPKKTPPPPFDRTHASVDLNHTPGTHFSTLPRKPTARDGPVRPSTLSRTASLHTRSQSLIDVGRGAPEDVRKASLNALIEQRRRGISKLRGLVIPEKVSEVVAPSHTICDLPEILSKDSILTTNKAPPATQLQRPASTNKWSTGQTAVSNTPQLVIPSPPWKSSSSTTNLPKYSPAFKRKSLTVYGSTGSSREDLRPSCPSFRNSAEPPASIESIASPTRSDLSFEYKMPTGKSAIAPGRHSMEDDSDNDSAVSSSRSSISPPPTPPPPALLSPLHRTLSSETTVSAASSTASTLTCGSSDSNRRVLKAQSVEAINRKNVLSSARYSSGRDLKVGSPLIQRKFDEDVHVAYLDEVEGPANEGEEKGADKLLEEPSPVKPMPAPRHVPVPPKPVQRKLLEVGPEEETSLLSVLTGGRGPQMRRQRSKDSVLGDSRRSVSVNDIRKAFEKAEMALANSGRKVNHARVSSLDSTASEDSFTPHYGSVGNLHREQFGSVTSIASSTSLISPQELQLLIEEANQPLEDSVGCMAMPVHDVVVVLLHREGATGSIGITLAGGADYEAKEITVHKVLAGSPADRDGRIQKGDRILSINGRSMKGVTHRESLNILKAPRSEVVLVVSRSRVPQDGHHDGPQPDDCSVATHILRPSRPPRIPEQPLETVTSPLVAAAGEDRGPPHLIVLTKDGAGLGFSLEGGKDSPLGDKPLTIKKIFTGGSAEKNGQLQAGDELLNVNGSDVTVLSRIEAWGLMKRLPDGPIALTVRHRLNK